MSALTLASGNYNGAIVLTGSNDAGQGATGSPQDIAVSYTIKPTCTLQTPSTTGLNFSTIAGINPASQSFSIGVTGACDSGVTLVPTPTTSDGGNWLSASSSATTIASGSSAIITVSVDASTVGAGQHSGTITLLATLNGSGIAGSSQSVNITLTVAAPPFLMATPSSISINVPGDSTSSPISLTNTGGSPLNWSATLSGNAPGFLSLSAASGFGLAGGANASFNVVVNPNGVASGQYQTFVAISASNAANGQPIIGSFASIPITVTIAVPVLQVNTTNINFSGFTGSAISPQSVIITNTGGGILSWTVSSPTQSWLSMNATAGSTAMGTSSMLTFSVQSSGMSASSTPSNDQVVITPAVGSPITINISLTLVDPTPTPNSMPTVTSTPVATATTAATADPIAVPSLTPTTLVSLPEAVDVRSYG
jgi:hypothetical protein